MRSFTRILVVGALLSASATVAVAGVRSIERYGTSPDGSSPQYKITCTNGSTHRYWWQSGEWWGPYGSVGLRNWSIEDIAQDRCG